MKVSTFIEGFSFEDEVSKMPYQSMGRTGLQISKLSLGSGPFGGEKFYGTYEKEEAEETVIKSIRKGINYIDTAPHYGLGVAETFLGSVLKKIPREAYYISTKVGRIGCDFNFGATAVVKSFEESLNRLQLNYVDIVIVHDVEFADSTDIILNETLPQIQKFVESGKAKFIGISGYPVKTLWEVVEKSKINIDCLLSYARDTLIDDTLQEYLPKFQEKGVAVINAGCIGMRLLSNMAPPNWHPASKEIKDVCRTAAEYCKDKGVELGNLALYHALKQPGSCTCLVGINELATLESNLNILRNGLKAEEQECLKYIQKNFFTPSERRHWEGVEVTLH